MKDPYIQNNGTLKNKFGITDYQKLNEAEKNITFTKFLNIDKTYKDFYITPIKNWNKITTSFKTTT